MGEKIRVLIVDDHPLMRNALVRTLHGEADIEVVGEGCNGDEAVEKASVLSPDVIIMDLGLPGKSGVQAIKEIVNIRPQAHILIFSGTDNQTTILEAVQAGAIGFLEKGENEIDIVKAVRETYHGKTTLKGDILHLLLSRPQTVQKKMQNKDLLTKRELIIIEWISNGYSDQDIAEKMFLVDSTVRSHINHALGKLNLKSRSELIRFVLTGGLDNSIEQ